MDFSKQLILWYLQNKRHLPWRKDKDPYHIWLSEIILQQTRILQGTPYYLKFLEKYPTIFDLAAANEDEVLNLWQGLGYYSRGRYLHYTAKDIVNNLHGNFPVDFKELKKLKGIGDYTASAIASISFGLPYATVDGNVFRVLSRFFNINLPINSSEGIKYFKELANDLLDTEDPGQHNQAVMELGALICTPKSPKCTECPLQHSCEALKQKTIHLLPVKENKIRIKSRYFNFFVFNIRNTHTLLIKRTQKDIWQHLYQFPLEESTGILSENEILNNPFFRSIVKNTYFHISLFNTKPIIHKLTHQKIYTQFWIIDTETVLQGSVEWKNVTNFAVPALIGNFIKSFRK